MAVPGLVSFFDRQQWLDPASDAVRSAVQGAFKAAGPAGRTAANGLYGVWIKHPLHPAITDVPVGAWTVALVLDLLGGADDSQPGDLARGADAAVAVGIAGALGSAASGLADWQHEYDRTARIGLAHGLLNIGATSLYSLSLLLRSQGKRGAARAFSLAGFGLVMTSGYLGGELVFGQRLGVDHTAGLELPKEFTSVLEEGELPEGTMRRVRVKGTPVLLARQNGQVYAMVERCSHRGGPLSEGTLEDGCVVCPWHGSRFALADGHVVDGPASFPQPSLEAKVEEGHILVRMAQED